MLTLFRSLVFFNLFLKRREKLQQRQQQQVQLLVDHQRTRVRLANVRRRGNAPNERESGRDRGGHGRLS